MNSGSKKIINMATPTWLKPDLKRRVLRSEHGKTLNSSVKLNYDSLDEEVKFKIDKFVSNLKPNEEIVILNKEASIMLNTNADYVSGTLMNEFQNTEATVDEINEVSNEVLNMLNTDVDYASGTVMNEFQNTEATVDEINEVSNEVNSTNSNCDEAIKYPNSLLKSFGEKEHFYENDSESSVYDFDSGSEYLPPSKTHNLSIESDGEISLKSNLSVDNFINYNQSSLSTPLSSSSTNEQKNKLDPEITALSKNMKPGYNFSATVQVSKKKQTDNKRVWDKTDCCIFCEKTITNFTRHIIRNHSAEIEVARYISLPKGSKERQILADQLRKRGNFFGNVDAVNVIKPVRRPNEFSKLSSNASDYLPCKHCYGLYKKNYLYRHEKQCKSLKVLPKGRNKAQADAQNLLLTFTETDTQLINEVFPRMAVDSISQVVKTDTLIKSYGTRYLKSHKEKHLINIVSQKMRTLARLLIYMRNEDPEIKTLQDCLVPKYFEKIVKCTKMVAGYVIEKDTFSSSPSVVLKMGSALKQCVDIAEYNILKNCQHLQLDDNQKNIKKSLMNMRSIIEKQWSYEIATNAAKEMYQKKWNKPAYLPLTSDIKIFRDYLISVQNKSLKELKENSNNLTAFRNLQECILCQLILLNRRRSGEVQRILLETYSLAPSELSQEEVNLSLSEIEKQLTKQFKRIVIRGKRGRGVPILFTTNMQKSINFLLKIRKITNFVDKENPFLFALPNSINCIRGSEAIRKLSHESGVKNPENLTSTKLRKQVATVAQLLNLSDGDIEQLATFLGHSKEVHKHFYRLSESTFQVAKVSKLLLMMEKGQGHEFRGKNLDEIDINVEALVSEKENIDDSSEDEMQLKNDEKTKTVNFSQKLEDQDFSKIYKQKITKTKTRDSKVNSNKVVSKQKNPKSNEKSINPMYLRVPWTEEERNITTNYFQKHILLKRAPKKNECENLKKMHPLLKDKPWKKIKTFVHKIIKKNL